MATETITGRIGATKRRWQPERWFGHDWRVAWLFIFPTVVLMGGLIAYPFLSAVWLSFNRVTGIRNFGFVGLDNYIDVWQDPFFIDSVRITIIFTFTSVAFKLVIGILAAILLNQNLKFRNVFTGLILLPWIIPEVVTAMTWRSLYDPTFGGINQALLALGVIDKGLPWLGEWALPSVIVVNIWKGIPFFTITLLAGIKAIDPELYDAASVDGANAWHRFLYITLPGLRYVILVSGLLSTIWTFNAFGIVYLITSGGPGNATRIYSLLAYREAFGTLRYSTGVTIALTLAPALIVVILILGRYMMTNPGREGESKRGISDYLALPFVLIFKALIAAFMFLNGLIENALSAIGKTLLRGVRMSGRTGRAITHTIAYVVVTILMLFEMMPFYWVFITSFKTELQITRIQSVFWPAPWTMDNINKLLFETAFPHWLWNSVQVAAVSTAIAVIVSALGAYALTRLRWRGSGFISNSILIAYLMPGALMFIPLYQIVTQLHLINTLGALIITYPTFVLPFASWLLMGYYRSIPEELEEAAMIDGCTRIGAFIRIVLPLVTPALLAVALFAITQAWNEFLFAFTMTASDDVQTLPVGLSKMIVGDVFPWGPMMAASLLTAIPVVILYMSAQKFMIQGMTAGSVKG